MYPSRPLPHLRLLILALITIVGANPASEWGPTVSRVYDTTDKIPLPNQGHLQVHDPNIILHNGSYYLFKGGPSVPIFKATNMTGPWSKIGTVLDGDSIIHTGNRSRPWAPTTIARDGTFYCYYTLSTHGSRKSAIGVATTTTLDGSPWTDHGAVIHTGDGEGSKVWPFTITNAIDASFITDNSTGKSYLNYGSFWHDIWQLPLSDDLLSIEDPGDPDAMQLTFLPHERVKPQEGSWMSYRDGYYYVWFSHGKCCKFTEGFPVRGMEYSIRVGRSKNVRGPFVDKDGQMLLDGGGSIVYASNHGKVYAPGGIGVLDGNETTPDILYYHYLNTSIGFFDSDAHLGWNLLNYSDGWPFVVDGILMSADSGTMAYLPNCFYLTIVMFSWLYIWS
ncbi:hypothetical protein N7448_010485 [Penicillium atrosanguineum]|uniref:Arabinan endo-1,5-alpha-L-arabinosidase n=1 Tax=Penicillium atrosanguineum TaxID=1132637 RepID=A0A9W9GGH9_9EURO|nr:uncharacterized protein N7443_007709 [Penicillium atrosanguineum]KAJ5119816.1 hypothetical protein N7448_010485 [Penicillium atrosanguineum]KAJ5296816.1 hypothetical protein N7443_007709 [Penicillium atrosanguineum]KAJ5299576.1 hypothetical protein N7476_011133 [Penicillium atrosanguineum]